MVLGKRGKWVTRKSEGRRNCGWAVWYERIIYFFNKKEKVAVTWYCRIMFSRGRSKHGRIKA